MTGTGLCCGGWRGGHLSQAGRALITPLPQITSLSHSPWDDWLLVGLASGQHWLQPTLCGQARTAGHKNGAILALKFSPYGKQPEEDGRSLKAPVSSEVPPHQMAPCPALSDTPRA